MSKSRLRRVTDLFVEGTTVNLGMDEDGNAVLVWVSKLNSFETEEARRDGVVERGRRISELAKPDNPEHLSVLTDIRDWEPDELAEHMLEFDADKHYLEVIDDLQSDEDWAELLERMRRLPELLDDEGAPEDDPRRATLAEEQMGYLDELRKRQGDKHEVAKEALLSIPRVDLETGYVKAWRERAAIVTFMKEQRVSQLYYSTRDCAAIQGDLDPAGGYIYDHDGCDHAKRMLTARAQVTTLPETLIEKLTDAYDSVAVGAREAGNSDAPRSSSAPLEPSSISEDQSAPSIPEEIPSVAPTT